MKQLALLALFLSGCAQSLAEHCASLDESPCLRLKACGIAARDVSCAVVMNNARVIGPACAPSLLRAVEEGRVRFDGAAARACIDRISNECHATCRDLEVFTGTLAEDEGCRHSAECAKGLWCDRSATCPGRCVPKRDAPAIVNDAEACDTDRWVQTSEGIRCVDSRPDGAACEEDVECGRDSLCVSKLCKRAPREGEDCGRCATGFLCMNNTCAAFAKRGEQCGGTFEGGSECQLGLACHDTSCGDAFREGEACGVSPDRCEAGLRCLFETRSRTCVPKGRSSVSCESHFDCADDFACGDNGRCVARASPGASCTADEFCALGSTCRDGTCAAPSCAP